jgi:hypothetical protein
MTPELLKVLSEKGKLTHWKRLLGPNVSVQVLAAGHCLHELDPLSISQAMTWLAASAGGSKSEVIAKVLKQQPAVLRLQQKEVGRGHAPSPPPAAPSPAGSGGAAREQLSVGPSAKRLRPSAAQIQQAVSDIGRAFLLTSQQAARVAVKAPALLAEPEERLRARLRWGAQPAAWQLHGALPLRAPAATTWRRDQWRGHGATSCPQRLPRTHGMHPCPPPPQNRHTAALCAAAAAAAALPLAHWSAAPALTRRPLRAPRSCLSRLTGLPEGRVAAAAADDPRFLLAPPHEVEQRWRELAALCASEPAWSAQLQALGPMALSKCLLGARSSRWLPQRLQHVQAQQRAGRTKELMALRDVARLSRTQFSVLFPGFRH